ncbi:MAG: Ig-like domain-containing protein, partial [Rhodocyclaceae bacterium]|nr:Ig-like domain-containing protein [Rhodocyclaceae bacterium]
MDKTAPAVASFDPADNAIGAMPTGNIVLTFSEKVRLGTGAILLKNGAGATVESFDVATSSRLSVSGATVSIDPSADLGINAKYSVVFAAGTVKDLAGNAYAGTGTYDFTTQGAMVTGTEDADTLQGTSAPERMLGLGGADVLSAKEGPDTLSGGAGDDTLDGGTGPDLLVGGTGNDTYRIDDPADAVDESGNADTGDLAVSSIPTDLALARFAGIEHLTFSGVLPLNGSGNAGANRLTGNDGANVLDGRGGADTLAGGKGNDTYLVDDGGDVVTEESALAAELDLVKSGVDFVLGSNLEHLTLTGT